MHCLCPHVAGGGGEAPSTAPATSEPAPSEPTSPSDTTAPIAVTIITPTSVTYASGETSFTLSGGCETGSTVSLSGAATQSTACVGGTYSFTISKSVDGVFSYNLSQSDAAGNISPSLAFQWTRNTVMPTPTITSPATSPVSNNASSLVISGTCSSNYTLLLSGDATDSVACSGGAFSFTINKSVDATYSFSIIQKDGAGNLSATVNQKWVRDTVAPMTPTLSAPTSNPFTSGDSSITISGSCEADATVSLMGASSDSQVCSSGQTYSFTISNTTDGSYQYSIQQSDKAGNTSGSLSFLWVRDTTIPATPVIATPTVAVYYSNLSTLTISGSCTTGLQVDLAGDSVQTIGSCVSSVYSFSVNIAVDGTYNFSVGQTDTVAGTSSGAATLSWVRDTSVPSAPTKVSPSSNPYTSSGSLFISGACESLATVQLTGDDTQTATCTNGAYSFTVVAATDGTYNYSVNQVDKAGNTSASFAQQWIKDSSKPSTPTIASPATSPYLSNNGSLTVTGGCDTGNTVTLGGVLASEVTSPNNSLTQTCANNQFSYTVSKAVDGTYDLTVKQTSPAAIDSAMASLQWILDTVVPNTTIATNPTDPNLGTTSDFSFSSDDVNAVFECSLDGAAYALCSSPISYASLANGPHSFAVRAKDSNGNIDATPASFSWTQSAGNTVALFHFNVGAETVDSGTYTGANQNTLTNQAATTGATGVFNEAVSLNGVNQWLEGAPTGSLALLSSIMTVEARVHHASLPTNGNKFTYLSKMGASPNLGWEFGIKKQGAKSRFYFIGSLNGTTVTEVAGANFTAAEETAITGGYVHVAATWNKGTVKFYLNGVAKGGATIGTAGASTLYNNTGGSLYIGRTGTGNYLNGSVDEVRLSQILRWSANFTPAAAAYTTD